MPWPRSERLGQGPKAGGGRGESGRGDTESRLVNHHVFATVTVIGIDDTDSREHGMCTTYVAARVAGAIRERGASVGRLLLVRLNPAVEYKTRGNAALAIHTDCDPNAAFETARKLVAGAAKTADPNTHPGLVVRAGDPGDVPAPIVDHARGAVRTHLTVADAREIAKNHGTRYESWKEGRGLVGALAAVGAWKAFEEWTYERITYREHQQWGTSRDVDRESVFMAAEAAYPTVWDTVDHVEGTAVCVPRTPGPVLHGVRGNDPEAVHSTSVAIEGEPVALAETFVTNQGTDAHLQDVQSLDALEDGHSYVVDGTVVSAPKTREGGHVFMRLADEQQGDHPQVRCVAFEPTKHFRDRVRALREGDKLTVCGEFTADASPSHPARGTLKLEKFAVRSLRTTEPTTPSCPECDRSMESAGRDQGYRCRDCRTSADGKVERPVKRALETGWYEVPPCARRHIAKPLIRSGFDAPTHPEQ